MAPLILSLLLAAVIDAQVLELVAGTGQAGFGGDGGPATEAQLNVPSGVFVDKEVNVYIADITNRRVRRIDPSGTIVTIAGSGEDGRSGDDGEAIEAGVFGPTSVFLDGAGVLYLAEWNGNSLRRIDASGRITSIAGTGEHGYGGEGQQAALARLWNPSSVFRTGTGQIYLSEWSNHRVRRIQPDGSIVTVAGTGLSGFSGDGGPATNARISSPNGVFVLEDGTVYFSDLGNQRVRRVDPDGTISTIAGTGLPDFTGDGGAASRAALNGPAGLFIDADGTLYITDSRNGRIRVVRTDGTIDTLIGPQGAGVPRTPQDVFVDTRGDLYIADGSGHRIYRARGVAPPTALPGAAPKSIDFDGNGRNDFADLLLFVQRFGASEVDPKFDLAEDGRIDFTDFLRFTKAFRAN